MWDPTSYLRHTDERSRPFVDLLSRVAATDPRRVVDLGCGPGTLTALLARRWPDAEVHARAGVHTCARVHTGAGAGSGAGVVRRENP